MGLRASVLPSVKWGYQPVPHGLRVGTETTRVKSTKRVAESGSLTVLLESEALGGRRRESWIG